MIVFDLECEAYGHRFEGWFASSDDYARQQERGLVCCPECGTAQVIKAPMAPRLTRKGNQLSTPSPETKQPMVKGKLPPEAVEVMQAMAKMQSEALKKSKWVGESFSEDARAMHYGEKDAEPIHGEASIEEAKELWEEGIEVMPLPFPVTPPGKAN
ncbi:MAG: DUF1178 family protein [Novosphingobium sp.]